MKNNKLSVSTIIIALAILILLSVLFALCGCQKQINTEDYIRLHIRADSDSNEAQSVKLAVRDEIVGYLSLKSNSVNSRDEMLRFLNAEIPAIEERANIVLKEAGFEYTCKASLKREVFPTKSYGDLTLPEGDYLALILELGSGEGQNWWCVAYPPLCFVATEDTDGDKVEYRSIIAEFFNKLSEKK